jgi:hypothetical protein
MFVINNYAPNPFYVNSQLFQQCALSVREESWVVPIWTMGGILTLAIILKILHLAAQHKESTAIYSLGNSFLSGTVQPDWICMRSGTIG